MIRLLFLISIYTDESGISDPCASLPVGDTGEHWFDVYGNGICFIQQSLYSFQGLVRTANPTLSLVRNLKIKLGNTFIL